ncbi:MAG: ABC transporter ATP-binding protein [Planctomycetota bacterium]
MAVLEVRGLVKRYGDVLAVDGVDLDVEAGQVAGLLGPNGSGKTTILSCCLGLQRPTSGEARVLGTPARALHRTRGKVGVVFDRPAILAHLSVAANMTYARRLRGHAGGRSDRQALELAGIERLAKRRAGRLSLGQAKRLSIAMALGGSPEFLVLDEPLSGLDPLGVREVLRLVARLSAEGATILLSSHRLLDVEPVLSHAVILWNGGVVAAGTLEELCGAGEQHAFEVASLERARACLARRGVAIVSASAENGAGTLVVACGAAGPAAVNRALVEAGVDVLTLRPARRSLAEVFEQLVDRPLEVVA